MRKTKVEKYRNEVRKANTGMNRLRDAKKDFAYLKEVLFVVEDEVAHLQLDLEAAPCMGIEAKHAKKIRIRIEKALKRVE